MHISLQIPALPSYHSPLPSRHHIFLNPIHAHFDCKPLPHFNIHAAQLQHHFPLPWNPLQMLVSSIFDKLETAILFALEKQHPLPSCPDSTVQLDGNFSPVPENAVQHHLDVEGRIPESLAGTYVRNGGNPMFQPLAAGHHLFDGDGMLHAVRFEQGVASYANRFTKTYRLQVEEKLGRPFFPKVIGELHGHGGLARLVLFYARGIFGLINSCMGMGVANAGIIFFNGHLLALSEDDLPYAVKITAAGDLQTLGRYDFDGQLRCHMIPHPKMDPETGEFFALSYDVTKIPYLRFFKFSPDGRKGPDVAISIKEPTLIHDFAITENFAVIPDQQVVFRLSEMMNGGSPVVYDKEKMSRFGILPRNAKDESSIMWVDVPNCFCFHLWNAWEDDDDIVIIASCMNPPDRIFRESSLFVQSILSEIRLNKITMTSTRRNLISSMNLEVGQVNRYYLGRKTQFIFLAIVEPWPKVSGIVKVDLSKQVACQSNQHSNTSQCDTKEDETNIVAKFTYPPNCYGGEPMFVPRLKPGTGDEDDGHVLTFMHNETTNKSEILILDAMSLKLLARVKLPFRVPYGFHGTFITNHEILGQNDA